MRVSYKLTQRDVLEARAKQGGLGTKVLPIFGLLLFGGSLVSLMHDPKQFPNYVGGIVMGLGLTFFQRLLVWFSFARDKRLHDAFEAVISDSGIEVSRSNVASKYGWNAFVRYLETKNLFLVYQGPQVFSVFPKRAFTTEEVDAFRSLLNQRLGAASTAYQKRVNPGTWAFLIVVAITAILLVMAIRNVR